MKLRNIKLKSLFVQLSILWLLLNSLSFLLYLFIKDNPTYNPELTDVDKYIEKAREYPNYYKFLFNNLNPKAYDYSSYIGWRASKHESDNLNIDKNGVRINPYISSEISSKDKEVWIFGGSTMWGFGVFDDQTIPYYLQNKLQIPVINFGEQGWVSRQELNFLLNKLDAILIANKKTPKDVIFYDGINDANVGCLSGSKYKNPYVHHMHEDIQLLVSTNLRKGYKYWIKGNLKQITWRLNNYLDNFFPGVNKLYTTLKISNTKRADQRFSYNKCSDKDYAKRVASNLITNWEAAYYLLLNKNINFKAILQPTPYDHPIYPGYRDSLTRVSYDNVYYFVKKLASNKPWFVDGTKWFNDVNIPVFTDDCCHLSPKGNELIAEKIYKLYLND